MDVLTQTKSPFSQTTSTVTQNSANIGRAVGHVTLNERAPQLSLEESVDQRMQEWLASNQIDNSTTEYEVAFFDEEPLGEISCLIVVQCGSRMWRAWETEDTVEGAFDLSLEHLHVEEEDPNESVFNDQQH